VLDIAVLQQANSALRAQLAALTTQLSERWPSPAASTGKRLGTHRDVFNLQLEAMTPTAFKKTLG
jgi:hypothetical protein